MSVEEFLQFLIQNGRKWVQQQRDFHRPSGRTLTPHEEAAFEPFFGQKIVNATRIKHVPIIRNPEFYADLTALSIPIPLDFTIMQGITFVDTILISQERHPDSPPSFSLIFHELTHVVQYSLLGRDDFVEFYVRGWAGAGGNYFAIPLERHAYDLQARYETDPSEVFSVEHAVRTHLGVKT